MGNMLLDMMGLLTRKKVTKTGEDQDFLVLGKTPKLDVDMMFTAPKMHNELIRLKDLKAYFDVGEISGSGSERTIPMFTASGDSIENSQLSQSSDNKIISNTDHTFNTNILVSGMTTVGAMDVHGNVEMNGGKIENLTDPVNPQEAATKAYVDANSGGGTTLTGTTNTLPVWTDGAAGILGDSILSQNAVTEEVFVNGKLVGTGTANNGDFYIESKTDDVIIRSTADDKDVFIQSDNGSGQLATYFQADGSTGASKLFHYGGRKLETTANGVDLFGTINANGTFESTGQASLATAGSIAVAQLGSNSATSSQFNIISTLTGDSLVTATHALTLKANNTDAIKINNTGKVQFNQYGTGAVTGTAAYNISVDASGNLIETPNSSSNQTLNIEDIKGSFYNVATLTDLNNISDALISDGQIVWVEGESATYQATITLADYINTFTDTITWNEFTGFQGLVETRGSWTPIVSAITASEFNISSYQIQQGHWVRHGNIVYVDFTIQVLASAVSGNSGSTSALYIHGWPFDAQGAGSTIQAPFLDFVDGFDYEVKSTSISTTTNDPSVIGSLRLQPMKQHPGVTNYFTLQNLYAGDFNNGNYFRFYGSMAYYTSNTTLTTGATQLP